MSRKASCVVWSVYGKHYMFSKSKRKSHHWYAFTGKEESDVTVRPTGICHVLQQEWVTPFTSEMHAGLIILITFTISKTQLRSEVPYIRDTEHSWRTNPGQNKWIVCVVNKSKYPACLSTFPRKGLELSFRYYYDKYVERKTLLVRITWLTNKGQTVMMFVCDVFRQNLGPRSLRC